MECYEQVFKADDDNMAILYITNGTARFSSFAGEERTIKF